MKRSTAIFVAAACSIGSFLVGDLLYAMLHQKKTRGQADQYQPCALYQENQGEEGCRPVSKTFQDVSYTVEKRRNPPQTFISIYGPMRVRDSDGYYRGTQYTISHGIDDPVFNAIVLALPPTNGKPQCHTEYMPMPPNAIALPKPGGGGLEPYLSAVDVDCDNTAEALRFWFRYQENGRTSYRPYPLPRIGADPHVLPLFEAVDRQLRELREQFHVSEIEAIVAREHQAI